MQLGLDRMELPATAIHLGQRRRKVDSASPATTASSNPPLLPAEPSVLPISDIQVSRPATYDILLEAACNPGVLTASLAVRSCKRVLGHRGNFVQGWLKRSRSA